MSVARPDDGQIYRTYLISQPAKSEALTLVYAYCGRTGSARLEWVLRVSWQQGARIARTPDR